MQSKVFLEAVQDVGVWCVRGYLCSHPPPAWILLHRQDFHGQALSFWLFLPASPSLALYVTISKRIPSIRNQLQKYADMSNYHYIFFFDLTRERQISTEHCTGLLLTTILNSILFLTYRTSARDNPKLLVQPFHGNLLDMSNQATQGSE